MNVKAILYYALAVVVVSALWIAYQRIAYRETKPDAFGRVTIRPGLVSWLLGLFSLFLFVMFVTAARASIILGDEFALFWMIAGPPLIALMAFGSYSIFWIRLRVSNEFVEYRGLNGWKKFNWKDVICVESHALMGPRLKVNGHRKMYFWPYGYGAQEAKNIFESKEKIFEFE